MRLNLSLFLKDPATTKEAPQTLAQEVDRSVKSLDAKLTIPVDMATEFMTQVAKLEGLIRKIKRKNWRNSKLKVHQQWGRCSV